MSGLRRTLCVITMLAAQAAFWCLVFAYFFYWSLHEDFPPDPSPGPGVFWPVTGGALLAGSWTLTLVARNRNRADAAIPFYLAIGGAVLFALLGMGALAYGPWVTGLNPEEHVYPATVWILLIWTALHVGAGLVMQLYCIAGSVAGRLTPEFRKAKRGARLYLDVARNGYAQTVVAPYSVRARPGAPVATPLDWDEVRTTRLTPDRWTIGNIFRRLGAKADPWRGINQHARPLSDAWPRLERLTASRAS